MSGPRRLPFSVSMRQWLTLARGVLLAALLGTASLLAGCGGVDEAPDPPPAQPVLSPPQCVPEDECVTTDSITLTWTVDGTVAGFELQWSSAAGRWPSANAVTLDGPARTWTHDGLSPNRTWRYRIRAINAQGRKSNWSRVVSATTLPVPKPAQPELSPPQCVPEDECVTTDSITLTWTVDGTVAGFELQWSSAAGEVAPRANAVTLDGPARTWTHDGLSPNRTWRYRIRAINAQGRKSNWSRVVSATTLPVPKPAQPELSPPQCVPEDECVTTDSITLTWTVDGTVAGFELQWSSAAGRWPSANAVTLDGPARTWTHDGLSPNRTWRYRIRAINAQGRKSNWSRVVSATTLSVHRPAQPELSPPQCAPADNCVTSDSITLTWTVDGTVAGFELQWSSVGRSLARGERRHPPRAGENLDPRRAQPEPDLVLPHPRDRRSGAHERLVAGGERHHILSAPTGPAGALSSGLPPRRQLRRPPPTASR